LEEVKLLDEFNHIPFMEVKVHKKGIIVLPMEVRRKLNITEGSRLELEVADGRVVLKPKFTLLDAYGIDAGGKEAGKGLLRELEEERRREVEEESNP